jgi:hypothetical protein
VLRECYSITGNDFEGRKGFWPVDHPRLIREFVAPETASVALDMERWPSVTQGSPRIGLLPGS